MSMRGSKIDWKRHIAQQDRSGLTIRDYCRREGFSSWSFYHHRKKLQQQNALDAVLKSIPVAVPRPSIIPVGTIQGGLPHIIVHFPGHIRMEVPVIPDTGHLECIVSTLQRCAGGRQQC